MSGSFPFGRLRTALSLLPLLAALACVGRGPEPLALVPADAEAIVSIAPARALSERLKPTVERLPEAAGVLDLVRSLAGFDLAEPDRTRHEGLDPDRGAALAWRGDALLVLLPVDDRALAGRRLGLRLARLGLIEGEPAEGGVRRFARDPADGLRVAMRVDRHVAVACFGQDDACDVLPAPAPSGAGDELRDVRDELALPQAEIAGRIRNPALLRLGGLLGLPVPRGMAGAMLGDLRFVASLEGGLAVRAAIGSLGDPFASTLAGGPPGGEALRLAVDAATLPAPWLAEALSRIRVGRLDLARLLARWDGRGVATVPAAPADRVVPLLSPEALAGLSVDVVAGFRGAEGAAGALVDLAAALAASGVRVDAVDGDAARGVSFADRFGLAGFAGPAGAAVWWASGHGAAGRSIVLGTRPDDTRRRLEAASGRLVRVQVDPGVLIQASGVTAVDFVRHLATGVRAVEVDVALEGLRLVVDAAVRVR
jgi:hypothetical protein